MAGILYKIAVDVYLFCIGDVVLLVVEFPIGIVLSLLEIDIVDVRPSI